MWLFTSIKDNADCPVVYLGFYFGGGGGGVKIFLKSGGICMALRHEFCSFARGVWRHAPPRKF